MLLYICRYFCILAGFSIIIMMLYKGFSEFDNWQPINVLEYAVPALIFIGVAYKSFPKEEKETARSKERQLNS